MKAVFLLLAMVAAVGFAQVPNEVDATTTPVYACQTLADGLYPDPDDCHNFFECSNGRSLFFRCPPGTAFYEAGGYCDFEDSVSTC